jgi:hypothetical protein
MSIGPSGFRSPHPFATSCQVIGLLSAWRELNLPPGRQMPAPRGWLGMPEGRWKLVVSPGLNRREFYRLDDDPAETKDLAGQGLA